MLTSKQNNNNNLLLDNSLWLKIFSQFTTPKQQNILLTCKHFFNLLKPYLPLDYSTSDNLLRTLWQKKCKHIYNHDEAIAAVIKYRPKVYASFYELFGHGEYGYIDKNNLRPNEIGICNSRWNNFCCWVDDRLFCGKDFENKVMSLDYDAKNHIEKKDIQSYNEFISTNKYVAYTFKRLHFDHNYNCKCKEIQVCPKCDRCNGSCSTGQTNNDGWIEVKSKSKKNKRKTCNMCTRRIAVYPISE
jgi:hypothetical protein